MRTPTTEAIEDEWDRLFGAYCAVQEGADPTQQLAAAGFALAKPDGWPAVEAVIKYAADGGHDVAPWLVYEGYLVEIPRSGAPVGAVLTA
jgi:hypothetical protein